ncbi:MAG: DUF1811 family protein [Alicyclobacillaceae bacterium]|nr:DUF1811 family protein [Alicyclobacillaceae bacterium]
MPYYSEMTPAQLAAELEQLRCQGQRAYDARNWTEYHTLMTKWYLAKSYLIQPHARVEIGKTYRLAEEDDAIRVTHLKGIMAWGVRESTGDELAVPIAMLIGVDTSGD